MMTNIPELKAEMVVEISYKGTNEKEIGIVSSNKLEIKVKCGYLKIEWLDETLDNASFNITKIYENTEEGLKLIFDRKDFIDWSKVQVDTKIYVRNNNMKGWCHRHFAKYEDGKVYAWMDGTTSFSGNGCIEWEQAKLA